MSGDIEKLLRDAMASPEGEKLMGKRQDIEALMNSSSGMKRAAQSGADEISKAAASGDTAQMAAALKKFSSSREGAELIAGIQKMMNG